MTKACCKPCPILLLDQTRRQSCPHERSLCDSSWNSSRPRISSRPCQYLLCIGVKPAPAGTVSTFFEQNIQCRRRPSVKRRESNYNLYCLYKPVRAWMLAVLMAFTFIVAVNINLTVSSDRSAKKHRFLRLWPLHEILHRTHLCSKSHWARSKPYAVSAISTTPILQSRHSICRGNTNRTARSRKRDIIDNWKFGCPSLARTSVFVPLRRCHH